MERLMTSTLFVSHAVPSRKPGETFDWFANPIA